MLNQLGLQSKKAAPGCRAQSISVITLNGLVVDNFTQQITGRAAGEEAENDQSQSYCSQDLSHMLQVFGALTCLQNCLPKGLVRLRFGTEAAAVPGLTATAPGRTRGFPSSQPSPARMQIHLWEKLKLIPRLGNWERKS